MKSNKHLARKENVISIVIALFFILGFLSLISLDNLTTGYITLEELGIRNSSIENTTVNELGNLVLIENISENSVESVGNLTFGINDSNLWGENENNLQFEIQGAGDQTVNLQYPTNNTNTSMRYINFTYNVSDADNIIDNCSLYLNIDGTDFINITTIVPEFTNQSDGFSLATLGSDLSVGITTNGSDFWITDNTDNFVYHTDRNGNNQSDGFSTTALGSNSIFGITTNGSDFWITDNTDDWVYHTTKTGTNISDGFSALALGSDNPRGITTNGSDFWIIDSDTDDWTYHTNRTGGNISDGFSPVTIGSDYFWGIVTNGSDFWITDDTDDFVYHTNRTGGNISDGFSAATLGSTGIYGITTDVFAGIGQDGSPIHFWTTDYEDDFVYHTAKVITETINQSINKTFDQTNHSVYWKVGCYADDSTQVNSSEYYLYIDPVAPAINLQSPINNTNSSSAYINFTYNATDTGLGISSCYLYINNGTWYINSTDYSVTETINQTFNITIEDSNILWKIGCNDTLNNKANSTAYNLTIDSIPPAVSIWSPINNTNSTSKYINFTYNVSDNPLAVSSCNLWLYKLGVWELNKTDTSITETINQTFNITIEDSSILWKVECNNTLNNKANSSEYNLTIDTTAPAINLQFPTNNTNSSTAYINFTYNATDTGLGISSCYLYINNGTWYINSTDYSVTESINQTFNLTIEDSSILWKIGCNDTLNNKANSTAYNLTIDTTPPTINLQYPANNTNSTISGINFTYNVSDATSNIQNCSLLLNIDNTGYINITTDIEIEESINQSINKSFDSTNHSVYWKVSCYDTLNNNGNSSEYYLYINYLPVITLISPTNSYRTYNSNVTFIYNVTDVDDSIVNCSLYLNLNETGYSNTTIDDSITEDTNQSFEKAFNINEIYLVKWKVGCISDFNPEVNSSENTLILSISNETTTTLPSTPGGGGGGSPAPRVTQAVTKPTYLLFQAPGEALDRESRLVMQRIDLDKMNLDPAFSSLLGEVIVEIDIDRIPQKSAVTFTGKTLYVSISDKVKMDVGFTEERPTIFIHEIPKNGTIRPEMVSIYRDQVRFSVFIFILIILSYFIWLIGKRFVQVRLPDVRIINKIKNKLGIKTKQRIEIKESPEIKQITTEAAQPVLYPDTKEIAKDMSNFDKIVESIKSSLSRNDLESANRQYQELSSIYNTLIIKLSREDQAKVYNIMNSLYKAIKDTEEINYLEKKMNHKK